MNNGDIISRETVALNRAMAAIVTKMYSREVVDDTVVEKIAYASDGLKVMGYTARPKEPGRYPVLIWNRGGTGDRGALDELRAHLMLASTAVWGFVVLATQYRGNMGGEGAEEWGCTDVNDSLNLLPVAEKTASADISRIGIEGASRGGMSTYCALKQEHRFRCAIVHAGISDLFELRERDGRLATFLEKRLAHLSLEEQQRELAERSAVYFAERLPKHAPILLLHGTKDEVVPMSQSEAMARELARVGIEHELVRLEGGGHHAHKDGSYRDMDIHRRRWLEKHLS